MALNLNLDHCIWSDCSDCSDCRLWLLVGSDRQRQTLIELSCTAKKDSIEIAPALRRRQAFRGVSCKWGSNKVDWGSKTKTNVGVKKSWFCKVWPVSGAQVQAADPVRQLLRLAGRTCATGQERITFKQDEQLFPEFEANKGHKKNLSQEKRDKFQKCDCPFLMNLDQC